eukprot:CAMPEP_0204079132 /NCGR_PEP_ID=MMETSP0360-20130528/171976_1 /ASSEMBLY_ACC=CAM_ASM_000342 /TAXON_ID=268821 /ORGANISM="Scrippsiella Hangoei, Strain SHTV-5" /LENGTH=155 /DNA_ID=CAMNT_0051027841 /DNA_START=90 /DNA_END=557 /DNA_ORIENTATION=-
MPHVAARGARALGGGGELLHLGLAQVLRVPRPHLLQVQGLRLAESYNLRTVQQVLRKPIQAVGCADNQHTTPGRLANSIQKLPHCRCRPVVVDVIVDLIQKHSAIGAPNLAPQLGSPSVGTTTTRLRGRGNEQRQAQGFREADGVPRLPCARWAT